MRPGQNNRRMRGRSRSKGPNPLTRSYESNGPDVKVRGTAQHIAEKYGQLARDAQASGDPVAAENYFQHAEHYLRIIATAQETLRQQYGNGRSDDDGDDEEEGAGYGYGHGHGHGQSERSSQPQRVSPEDVDPALQPQPPSFDPRPDRQGERDYQPRGRGDRRERFQRPAPDNRSAGEAEARSARTDAPPPAEAPAREETASREEAAPRRGRRRAAPSVSEEAVEQASLPDFLTRPVARSTEDAAPAEEPEAKPKRRRAATTTTTTRRTTRKSAAAATEDEGSASSEGEGGSDKTAAE